MHIPFQDLTRQYKKVQPYLDRAVAEVMKSGVFLLGKQGADFEARFSAYIGTRHAVGVGSGTDALALALRATGIGPGDEVILSANAYPSAFGVALSDARIRLVDCGYDGNLDAGKLKPVVTSKTKAIVAVHMYGNPADVLSIQLFIDNNNPRIVLIEDAAQAHGAEIRVKSQESRVKSKTSSQKNDKKLWKKAGSIGDIGCFSFYPTKNLGACGDAGMITTNDRGIALRCRVLRMYGETKRYESRFISGISRMDELQAAIVSVKLRFLDAWNKRKKHIAEYYISQLKELADIQFVLPTREYVKSSYHVFVIRTKDRNRLRRYVTDNGIGTGIHYPLPIHLVPSFRYLGYHTGDFPVAEAMSREILSLPIFPELTDNEVAYIAKKVRRFYESKTRRRP